MQNDQTMDTPKKASTRFRVFEGLKSPKEKMLVAKYGKLARPATDVDSTEEDELRASVFGYVLESYSTDEKFDGLHEKCKGIHDTFKGIDEKLELYQCLEGALKIGSGKVFRDVADSVDAITHAHKNGWYCPEAVMLLSEYFPKPLGTKPNLWDAWGGDMVLTSKELLAQYGNHNTDTSNLRKLAVALGIDLNGGPQGRPPKKVGTRKG